MEEVRSVEQSISGIEQLAFADVGVELQRLNLNGALVHYG
jgi:hypothetical protein